MLVPIDDARLGQAMDLLERGFPRRTRRDWEDGIERLRAFDPAAVNPIGHMLVRKNKPCGVLLTLRGQSVPPAGAPFKVTNLSSWYIEPEHRMLAPLMLRDIVRASGTVFTDLTPSDRVIPMLPAFGFQPLNRGISAVTLPVAAMKPTRHARVSNLTDLPEGALLPTVRTLLERHVQQGAIAGVLNVGAACHPLLFLPRLLRGLPTAQLIYCDSNSAVVDNLGAIARFLLKRGKVVLLLDVPLDGDVPGTHFPNRGMKFAKGGCFKGRTDYAGSELLFFRM
jgi:hypothetical protein